MILIENCALLPMDGSPPLMGGGAVLIDGDRLSYVGSQGGLPAVPAHTVRIDGAGQIAMPGMIDAHTHLGLGLMMGYVEDRDFKDEVFEVLYPAEAAITDAELALSTRVSALARVKGGTTTVLDHYHRGAITAAAVDQVGIRAELALMAMDISLADPPPRDADLNWVTAFDPSLGAAELRANVELAQNLGSERISWRLGVNTTDTVSDETLMLAVQLAGEHGLGLHLHASQSPSEVRFSQANGWRSPIAHLEAIGMFEHSTVLAHATAIDEADIDAIADTRALIAHCPISNAKGAGVAAPAARIAARGARIALGSDGSSTDLFEISRAASAIGKLVAGEVGVIPAEQALRMCTIDAAEAIGRGHELGSLEVGKLADVILVDTRSAHLQPFLDPVTALVYNARGADVTTVIIDGEIVVQEGGSTRVDERALVDEYGPLAARFHERHLRRVISTDQP